MGLLTEIRSRAKRAQPIFDYLWDRWSETDPLKWPLARSVCHRCGKSEVDWAANKLNDAYLIECEPSNDPTFELRLFGALASSHGDEWLGLLTGFWEFMREAFGENPARTDGFPSEEVGRRTRMDATELRNLGRLLSFHPFEMMNLGYGSPPFVGWQAGIPKGFFDIGQPGDARKRLEAMLARRYQPRLPVGLDARQQALSRIASAATFSDEDEEKAAVPVKRPAASRRAAGSGRARGRISVFISHSSKDKEFASAVMELLRAALGIPPHRIRCTSIPGSKLSVGADTDEQIRADIAAAKVFIGLLTPASLRSAYVLAELGARWQTQAPLAGLLAKGANGGSLSGPIARLNMLNAHDEAELHQFLGDVGKTLHKKLPNPSEYLNALKTVRDSSIAGDPVARYERKRVKVRGFHRPDQYFIFHGRTHYVESEAAQVCEEAKLDLTEIDAEDADVLFSDLGGSVNAAEMRRILGEIRSDT